MKMVSVSRLNGPAREGTPLGRRWGRRRVWRSELWTPNTEHRVPELLHSM